MPEKEPPIPTKRDSSIKVCPSCGGSLSMYTHVGEKCPICSWPLSEPVPEEPQSESVPSQTNTEEIRAEVQKKETVLENRLAEFDSIVRQLESLLGNIEKTLGKTKDPNTIKAASEIMKYSSRLQEKFESFSDIEGYEEITENFRTRRAAIDAVITPETENIIRTPYPEYVKLAEENMEQTKKLEKGELVPGESKNGNTEEKVSDTEKAPKTLEAIQLEQRIRTILKKKEAFQEAARKAFEENDLNRADYLVKKSLAVEKDEEEMRGFFSRKTSDIPRDIYDWSKVIVKRGGILQENIRQKRGGGQKSPEPKSVQTENEDEERRGEIAKSIERLQKSLTEREAAMEAVRKRLAEIEEEEQAEAEREKAAFSSENASSEETSEDIEKQGKKMERERDDLIEKRREKSEEWMKVPLWRVLKYNRLEKEVNQLNAQISHMNYRISLLHVAWQIAYDQEQEQLREAQRKEAERQEQVQREEEERRERERIRAIDEDRERNSFKYFMIDNMSDEIFYIIFGSDRKTISLEELNKFGESGKDLQFWEFKSFPRMPAVNVEFTSNGFILQLQNADEVRKEEDGKPVLDIYSPKAKYKVITPGLKYIRKDLSYKEARELMRKEAEEYQKQKLAEFENREK